MSSALKSSRVSHGLGQPPHGECVESYLVQRRTGADPRTAGHGTLGFADTLIGVLREAGFAPDDAARAALALVHFTLGHTLEKQAALQVAGDGPADPDRLRAAVTPARYPHLAPALPVLTSTDFAAHFTFGLRLLLEGLRATGPGPVPPLPPVGS
ncbi:TetR/AcrR family transcriptional regulator C-terminal domain-containing protein [Streptomyces sp. DSM 41527]|uniref:TetR/AcrR family transcriptional regulator C-terminal domain-containing protein n=1 Tax=Streptomyces mooreae TaxID=3075523 RepID=A0ABU2T9S6_9ACTN|nr:TetR/AcrR family transcriptional regulator C-terminal domain-containing protein [Streptomyces sp. DSM 41527]MDT0457700.1 TetR/AcrR family transcriptional regulator C-terminal domain-containing protein [Streptomyces sp. DSM 41527]